MLIFLAHPYEDFSAPMKYYFYSNQRIVKCHKLGLAVVVYYLYGAISNELTSPV